MGTFTRYSREDISISTDKVTSNTWTNNTNALTTTFTSSTQAVFTDAKAQGNFFLEIRKGEDTVSSSVEYTVSYGHRYGSGSENFTNTAGAIGNTATKCVYNQYRQLVFGDENSNFNFNGFVPNDIHVLNIDRGRFKHNLKQGSLNLKLKGNNTIHLTDDSITTTGSATITNIGRQFNVISGSDGVMSGSELNQTPEGSGSYGFIYPDVGIIILNGEALRNYDTSYWTEGDAASAQKKIQQVYGAIKTGASFELDSEERISSQFIFTRIKNAAYNYTTNPSYIYNNGDLLISDFVDSPTTYVTTIGLYNDNNNLIAVAKLSQPLKKDFTTEALVRVKLDY